MPSFQRSAAILPLPIRCSVVTLPFCHSVAAIAVARENRIAGNICPLTAFEVTRTLIGCPPMAEQQK